MTKIREEIKTIVENNDIILFMKGSKDFPQCGFSATVSHILNTIGVDFVDIDILKDPELRQGIKEFSDWPTIPQLYVKGEFVGGCDIIKEMAQEGELLQLLQDKGIVSKV